jgi:hypothetical protein
MNNDRFSSGFLLGLIIGGGAVFLFGTKTGKKLLKEFSESGMEGINEILQDVEVSEFEDEPAEDGASHQEETAEEENPKETKTNKKRFFKRAVK